MTHHCSRCKYCKMIGRSEYVPGIHDRTGWKLPRGFFYCQHPKALARSGDKSAFVSFGKGLYREEPSIKTCPRWCPLKEEE